MNDARGGLNEDLRATSFRTSLLEFSMGELKYMFRIVQTKPMIRYYGANRAKQYKQAIYDRMLSRKIRGIECEVWQ